MGRTLGVSGVLSGRVEPNRLIGSGSILDLSIDVECSGVGIHGFTTWEHDRPPLGSVFLCRSGSLGRSGEA